MTKKKNNCTLFPDRSWNTSCCAQHDEDYKKGSGVSRSEADKKLRECVKKNGKPVIAWLMWLGVRLGGWWHYEK